MNDQPTVSFFLHDKSAKRSTAIKYNFKYKGQRLRQTTGISLNPIYWDFSNNQVKPGVQGAAEINAKLFEIKTLVEELYYSGVKQDKIPSTNEIILHVKEIIDETKSRIFGVLKDPSKSKFFSIFDEYLQLKAHLSEKSLKRYRTLQAKLHEYEIEVGKILSIDRFSYKDWRLWVNWLSTVPNSRFRSESYRLVLSANRGAKHTFNIITEKDERWNERGWKPVPLMDDTISKLCSDLKEFFLFTKKARMHLNESYLDFDVPKRKAKHENIVLNAQELLQLEKVKKEGKFVDVINLFLFETYTSQRIADVRGFELKDIVDDKWVFYQQKTDKLMSIPLVGYVGRARPIIEHYAKHGVPNMPEQKLNERIKLAAKEAGIDSPVTITRWSGQKKILRQGQKWQYISTHTGRRTAATILLKYFNPAIVQQITGHADIRTLQKYVNLDTTDVEEALNSVGDFVERNEN